MKARDSIKNGEVFCAIVKDFWNEKIARPIKNIWYHTKENLMKEKLCMAEQKGLLAIIKDGELKFQLKSGDVIKELSCEEYTKAMKGI